MSTYERTDGVVAIRPYRESDAARLVEAALESVAEVGRWLPWCHAAYGIREAREWVASARALRESGGGFHLAVVAADLTGLAESRAGELLGGVGLGPVVKPHGIANLGYWVRTGAAGRGICTRAVRLLVPLAFELGFTRLEVVAACGNTASLRVAEKVGARREGVLRNRLTIHGELHDAVGYSVVPGDFP
jgi:RimJ/RimL family protein N-acetyltransferase